MCPATGIFVNDILDAVPIDKYFELFKPGAGGEGGYIRISINFVKDLKDLDKSTGARNSAGHEYLYCAKVRDVGMLACASLPQIWHVAVVVSVAPELVQV